MRALISVMALFGAVMFGKSVSATDLHYRYETPHQLNAQAYSFTVTNPGAVTLYTMPSTGYYESTLSVKVNGAMIANGILPLGSTSPDFHATTLGSFNAGDVIEFLINVYDRDAGATYLGTYSSDQADNADGLNHVYASDYPGEPWIGVPSGTFLGFEDTTAGDPRNDNNYNDYTFVVSNLTIGAPIPHSTAAVPEPANWAMMVGGFGLIGGAMRRRGALLAFA